MHLVFWLAKNAHITIKTWSLSHGSYSFKEILQGNGLEYQVSSCILINRYHLSCFICLLIEQALIQMDLHSTYVFPCTGTNGNFYRTHRSQMWADVIAGQGNCSKRLLYPGVFEMSYLYNMLYILTVLTLYKIAFHSKSAYTADTHKYAS